ncbi:hypothetical protein Tco_1340448 [Tanacetum coccineum]
MVLTQFFYDHVNDYTRMDLDFAADGNLRELSGEEAWEAIEKLAQGQKEWDNPPNIISEQEEYTPPVTYPKEVEETLGTPIEAEPLDKTQLDDLGLNTCNHDIPLSFREVPSFDKPEPQPQPLPNSPPLDVCLGNKTGLKPPIKPHSSDSFRIKVLDDMTIHTLPLSLVASFQPKDTYCYYHPCIDDPKKHYGFKPCLFGQSGSLERGFDYLTFALVSSKAHREGVGLRVADSHTEDPIRASKGRPSNLETRDSIAVQRCGLSAKELNEFLSFYPIPSEYDVILPTSTQTIFNAPLGYVGLYTHSFSLANLRLPFNNFFCEYPQLLLDENKLDSKSFKDKLHPNIDENLYFQRLGRYPTSVHVFDDPILFLASLKPSWEFGQQRPAIIMGGKEPSPGFGIGSPSASVNTEPLKDVKEPEVQPTEVTLDSGESLKASVFVVHPGSVAARIKERKCKIRGGSLRPPIKRKLAFGSSSSHAVNSLEADKARLEAVEVSLRREVKELKQDRRDIVSKVVHYAAMNLVHSDKLGRLVGKLVSSAITY